MNGVVCWFTFSVGSDDEDCSTSFGDLIEVFEVVFLRVAYQGSKTELGLCFLGDTDSIAYFSAVPVCEP